MSYCCICNMLTEAALKEAIEKGKTLKEFLKENNVNVECGVCILELKEKLEKDK